MVIEETKVMKSYAIFLRNQKTLTYSPQEAIGNLKVFDPSIHPTDEKGFDAHRLESLFHCYEKHYGLLVNQRFTSLKIVDDLPRRARNMARRTDISYGDKMCNLLAIIFAMWTLSAYKNSLELTEMVSDEISDEPSISDDQTSQSVIKDLSLLQVFYFSPLCAS